MIYASALTASITSFYTQFIASRMDFGKGGDAKAIFILRMGV